MGIAKVGIVGASGFTGKGLIEILLGHGGIELQVLNSATYSGKNISDLYAEFTGSGLEFTNYSVDELKNMGLDLVFLAMPDGEAQKIAPKLLEKGIRVIDLSKDYRFSKEAAYGLPELFADKIKGANLVANPGCYATACLLAAKPLDKLGGVKHFIFDCKSGVSGAGKTPTNTNNLNFLAENIFAYNLTKHKHVAEIQQFLDAKVSFTPHVLPIMRGIMCTMHVLLEKKVEEKEVKRIYEEFYSGKEFVKVLGSALPELHGVQQGNYCHIGGFEIDGHNRLVVISTIDNLMKGASGQAVQNMNLMLDFKESKGLERWKSK
ncbi:MAG: N-acetyl-gamma-glutamyl-phosphate reductase [Candidatus Diapherotrites archaeon]